jgi:hypothetical protein
MLIDETAITTSIFILSGLIVAAMVLLEKRAKTDFRPSLIPTTPILLLAGAVGLFACVHLLNLYGVHTGR